MSQDTRAFAEIARGFCNWVEAIADASSDTVLVGHRLLAELQLLVLRLPNLWPDKEQARDEFDVEDWKAVRDGLHTLPIGGYWKVFDVFAEAEQPVYCTIPDDLADIYVDLKEGLEIFDQGGVDEAAWHWRFTYFVHWGRHLTGAQSAFHQYLSDVLV